jgi:integrase
VYALKYRAGRLQRIYTLGVHGSPLTPEQARDDAKAALRAVAAGKDPAESKKAAQEALTVAQLIDKYLEVGPSTKLAKRASTWEIDGSNLNRHIRPLLGRKLVDQVSATDANRAIKDVIEGKTAKVEKSPKKRGRIAVKGGAGTARRTRTTVAAMFAWGIKHGYASCNPFEDVELPAAPKRERFLSADEAGRLLDALNDLEARKGVSAVFADAIRLLLLTGARKTEILGLRWSELDVSSRSLVLPPERTKAGGSTGERRVALSPAALQLLERRRPSRAKPSDFVFPSSTGQGHAVGIRRAFVTACEAAELTGVRVHDLRHTFASFAIAGGSSLFLVGKLLGHASARTTERYAHLSNDPLAAAAAAIGNKLMPASASGADDAAGGQRAPAEIHQLPTAVNCA